MSPKKRSKLILESIEFFSKKLAPRLLNKLQIDVEVIKGLKDAEGIVADCIWEDQSFRPREFTIRIDADLEEEEFVHTIAHEMVHVKQFARGELFDYCSKPDICRWKKEDVNIVETSYYDLPWEIEAEELSKKLFEEFVSINKEYQT